MSDKDQAPFGAAKLERLSAKLRNLQRMAHELSNQLLIVELEMELTRREIQRSQGDENHGQTTDNLEAF